MSEGKEDSVTKSSNKSYDTKSNDDSNDISEDALIVHREDVARHTFSAFVRSCGHVGDGMPGGGEEETLATGYTGEDSSWHPGMKLDASMEERNGLIRKLMYEEDGENSENSESGESSKEDLEEEESKGTDSVSRGTDDPVTPNYDIVEEEENPASIEPTMPTTFATLPASTLEPSQHRYNTRYKMRTRHQSS